MRCGAICFNPQTFSYCSCIHIKLAVYIAAVIAIVTQCYMSIFYLYYHIWWAFIPFFGGVIAYLLLAFSVWKRNSLAALAYLVFQAGVTLMFLAASIWMLVVLCTPKKNFVFDWCKKHDIIARKGDITYYDLDHCIHESHLKGGVYFPLFLIFFFVNLVLCDVFLKYYRYLKHTAGGMQSARSVNRAAPTPISTVYRDNTPSTNYNTSAPGPTATISQPTITPRPTDIQLDPFRTSREMAGLEPLGPRTTPTFSTNPYSGGNPYPAQPIQAMIPPTHVPAPYVPATQPAYNNDYRNDAPYPTVRGRPDDAYAPPTAPNAHLYDAPPAYGDNKW